MAVCGVRRLFELAKGLIAAAGVARHFAEEGVEFIVMEQGQQPTAAAFRGACVPRNPMLARLLLTLVAGKEPLSPALGRLGPDMVPGPEGPRAGALLAEYLVQLQCDLGLGGRGRIAGEPRRAFQSIGGPARGRGWRFAGRRSKTGPERPRGNDPGRPSTQPLAEASPSRVWRQSREGVKPSPVHSAQQRGDQLVGGRELSQQVSLLCHQVSVNLLELNDHFHLGV